MTSDVAKRLHTTVPDYVALSLEERAEREGRSISSLIAFVLEEEVKHELHPSSGQGEESTEGKESETT